MSCEAEISKLRAP